MTDLTLERIKLARRASTREAGNRPLWMPLLGALLVIAAIVYVLTGISARDSARTFRDSQLSSAQQIRSLIGARAQLTERLAEIEQGSVGERGPKGPITLLTEAAERAGIAGVPLPSERTERTGATGQLSRRLYDYRGVQQPDVQTLLNWIAEVRAAAPSIDVHALTLINTETAGWKMNVTFARVEDAP